MLKTLAPPTVMRRAPQQAIGAEDSYDFSDFILAKPDVSDISVLELSGKRCIFAVK